jgi:hypothetical protein
MQPMSKRGRGGGRYSLMPLPLHQRKPREDWGELMKTKERPLAVCVECGRLFDLSQDLDAQEWAYGHDCEVSA